jgi:glycosyltransferase involved in cell wall biosynthesis
MPEQPRRRGRPPLTPEQRTARAQAREAALRAEETELPPTIEEAAEEVLALEHTEEVVEQPLKVHIYPHFTGEDQGDGGIRRVVEHQIRYLPQHGIQIVDTPEEAEVIAYHATVPPPYIRNYPRKTFVAMCHGMYWNEYEWSGVWHTKANEEVMEGLRVADAIIACSEWVANAIRRHLSRPVSVIYHGVEMDEWARTVDSTREEIRERGIVQQDFVLWNKTRPDPVCDPEPMNIVASMLPDVNFISTFGERGTNVAITGKLPFEEARKLVASAAVYLCTSRETFGIGTLEAMACGVPIVGFNWGGQAEFIEHGIDGWLVAPGDFNGLAEGIRWALGPDRNSISAATRRKAAAFDWNNLAGEYADVFKSESDRKRWEANRPRVSIVVTHHNLSRYLEDCLASVLNQTDTSWECIVVDDASDSAERDAAIRIVAGANDFARPHQFKFEVLLENVYLAEARNHGIRMARGRYILPLDADDMLDPDAVALLADALDGDRTIAVAYGNVRFTEENGQTLTNYGSQFPLGHSSWPYQFVHEYQLMQRNLLPYCSMFRKNAWKWTGGYRRRCKTAEDADFWCRLSSYGFRPKMVTEHDTLIYRNRLDSMSRIQGETDWVRWFPWSKQQEITPAGAGTREQLPVASLDPIVVSVVIPVGPGHEKIVTDAIDSVDAQFFRDWECIVVNDTGIPGVIKELPAWVRVIGTGHAAPKGVAFARNLGIEKSKGRYFVTLDADDFLEPDALQYMVDAVRETGGEEVIYTDFWQQDAAGNITVHHTDDYDPNLLVGRRRQVDGQNREGMIHSAMILCSKKNWRDAGGYDEALPAWEDWDFQLSLGKIGVCSRRIAIPLFFYRKQTGYRREENMAFFETSRAGIEAKWGDLFQGRGQLLVCQRCGGGRTISSAPVYSVNRMMSAQTPPNSDAKLVRYTGEKRGAILYRAPSRTQYSFGYNEEKYVLAGDVGYFLHLGDFAIVEPRAIVQEVEDSEQPILAAPGQV